MCEFGFKVGLCCCCGQQVLSNLRRQCRCVRRRLQLLVALRPLEGRLLLLHLVHVNDVLKIKNKY